MSVVDNAVYVHGRRWAEPTSIDRTLAMLREDHDEGAGFAWIGLRGPDDAEMSRLAHEFALPSLAVEDAVHAHQRPKIERYDDVEFVVLRPAWYVDEDEDVGVGEVHVFLGHDFVVTVRHAETPDLAMVRRRLEGSPELLVHGPRAVLYAILDRVVDDYRPVVAGLREDLDEIETQVFGGDPSVSQRIYQLSREVIEFQRACEPLRPILEQMLIETADDAARVELHRGLRDVADHVASVIEATDGYRQLLERLLTVNASLIGQRQNEEMRRLTETSLAQGEQVKKISSWAAIIFAPQLVAAVYGMNFDEIPELHWALGYPFALTLMALTALTLFLIFRRVGWLGASRM